MRKPSAPLPLKATTREKAVEVGRPNIDVFVLQIQDQVFFNLHGQMFVTISV